MNIIGIIAEYNPLHNGHLYHIKKIKEKYPDSIIILALNGYFTERGEISIITKEKKTELALQNNIDIVLELPSYFGTQSADIFANAAIKILNYYKVEKIIIGSEENNINKLIEIANIQLNDKDYDNKVKNLLKEGVNYPTALAKALDIDFSFLPNDLLGISYAKAIIKNNYNIQLETIKRTNDYKDLNSNDEIISASNIREKINNNININKFVPKETINNIIDINYDNYYKLLKYNILVNNELDKILDVDEGIENRLKKYIINSNTLDEFINIIKTKRYTYNKLNRLCIHILLNHKKEDNHHELDYIKILGFNSMGKKYINKI